ncbi:MAG TPA: SRPBCC family protein [Trinickia sp.]|jgi:hypothetical protein|nr:SRPBCC family protein [Trinickia sp.]
MPENAEYRMATVWRIGAPVRDVWDAIHDATSWPLWWKNAEAVREIEAGAADGLNAVHRYTWKGVLPYRLIVDVRVTRVEPFVTLEGEASGELEGVGRWHFAALGAGTIVHHHWHVRTKKAWMNAVAIAPLAPLARAVFRWNHDAIMHEGGLALARRLDAQAIAIEHGSY